MFTVAKPRALISVSDKRGAVEFARELISLGYEVVSSGGTAKALRDAGLDVLDVSEVTGFPEMLDGRVKTLHPKVHAGILARPTSAHMGQLATMGIEPIDIVAVNLYPFQRTVDSGADRREVIENIDIGGPSMVRSAAKNHERVAVVVNPDRYPEIIEELRNTGAVSEATRRALAAEAFRHTAAYDAAIAGYLGGHVLEDQWVLGGLKVQSLRYGENPHQQAAFYRLSGARPSGLAAAKQLAGKELSYNNIMDADAAVTAAAQFAEHTCVVIVKHGNPCGIGIGATLAEAYQTALAGDPVSAFGGIVAATRRVDREAALLMKELFLEVIVAPGFDDDAVAVLTKKQNLRLLAMPEADLFAAAGWQVRPVLGGFLVQEADSAAKDLNERPPAVVTRRLPTDEEMAQLSLAWKAVARVKSNAIVLWKGNGTVGVGAGQMNRVLAAKIAIETAGERAKGSVLASDAFFPFPDTVEAAAAAGVTAIIQPGGSVRDQSSIDACDAAGIAMVFTGKRHFLH